ncbi:MAG: DUF1223 domain-containing protein [Sphingomonadales bacterium]|jgi:hypothetical protein
MKKRSLFTAGLALLFSTATVSVQAGSPVVVELFTSQGCSSCPPADKVLAELSTRDDIIALSWAVDYWDYLGWKDTNASAANTMRQRVYNNALGRRIVYTPQMILDGKTHLVGSNKPKVMKTIETFNAQSDDKMDVTIERDADGQLTAHLADMDISEKAVVRMIWFDDAKTVKVGRGENRGKELTYHNVVRGSQVIGQFDGQETSFNLPIEDAMAMDCDSVAVLVQADPAGPVIGAAQARIN